MLTIQGNRLARFLFLLAMALAGGPLVAAETVDDAVASPDQLIRDTVAAFREELRFAKGKSPERRKAIAEQLVAEHVTPNTDFELMARSIFAAHWDEIEREGLTDAAVQKVRRIVQRIHVGALAHYSNQRIRVFTAEVEGNQARVHLKVDAYKTFTVDIYLTLGEDGHWKIHDFALLGASFVQALAKGYGDLIDEKGLQAAMGDDSVRMEGEV